MAQLGSGGSVGIVNCSVGIWPVVAKWRFGAPKECFRGSEGMYWLSWDVKAH